MKRKNGRESGRFCVQSESWASAEWLCVEVRREARLSPVTRSFRQGGHGGQVAVSLALKILHLRLQRTQFSLSRVLLSTQGNNSVPLLRLTINDLALLRARHINIRLQAVRPVLLQRNQPIREGIFSLQLLPAD